MSCDAAAHDGDRHCDAVGMLMMVMVMVEDGLWARLIKYCITIINITCKPPPPPPPATTKTLC